MKKYLIINFLISLSLVLIAYIFVSQLQLGDITVVGFRLYSWYALAVQFLLNSGLALIKFWKKGKESGQQQLLAGLISVGVAIVVIYFLS